MLSLDCPSRSVVSILFSYRAWPRAFARPACRPCWSSGSAAGDDLIDVLVIGAVSSSISRWLTFAAWTTTG